MEGRKGDTKRETMTKTQSSGISGAAGAEGRDLAGPRSKIVYNEEAAGRPGTGSSHYRRSSSATRLSVLVARHANVERPARCTCSCTAHRSSVTAAPHTRALSIFLRASSSLYPHLLPFLFEPASGLFRSFCSVRPPFALHSLQLGFLFSFGAGERVPRLLFFFFFFFYYFFFYFFLSCCWSE